MPIRTMKPCKHRGCGALVAAGKSYCAQHTHEAVKWKSDAVRQSSCAGIRNRVGQDQAAHLASRQRPLSALFASRARGRLVSTRTPTWH
ncbi:hypothetical protein DO71_6383 [Burkholderia pseudomallei]|nr:hypothetical protein DO71_6383 [Burkholderia pseudomallei]